MKDYFVSWEIEIRADSARQAAEIAQIIHRDPNSTAWTFLVFEEGRDEAFSINLDDPE